MASPDDSGASPARRRGQMPAWLEIPLLLVVAVVVALLIKTFLVQIFYIPSGSMENTLLVGDRVAVNRLAYRVGEPERGDVVVFDGVGSFVFPEQQDQRTPWQVLFEELGQTVGLVPPPDTVFVKRIIGVGGDRVVCCDAQGRITVNGEPIDEAEYLYPGDDASTTPFDVQVPDGKVWVMGDHRAASADSRAHMGQPGGGFVPEESLLGRVSVIIWPPSRWAAVPSVWQPA